MNYSRFLFLFFTFFILAGCADKEKSVHHPGLSDDGYGFVKNGPRLPPPPHLLGNHPMPTSTTNTAEKSS